MPNSRAIKLVYSRFKNVQIFHFYMQSIPKTRLNSKVNGRNSAEEAGVIFELLGCV